MQKRWANREGDIIAYKQNPNDYGERHSGHGAKSYTRDLFPEVQAFFESEEEQQKIAERKVNQQSKQEKQT